MVHGNSGVQDMITELLAAQQLQRRELLELPSYLMVPPLLALGEFLAVVPAQLADVFNAHGTLALLPLPFRLPPSTVRLYWHRRFNDDAGLRWLRELLVGELSPRSASA
jgi:DNA-binding transcriptional LysR family regulator